MCKFAIVGTGFYGSTLARKLADAGHRVVVYEKSLDFGGHCKTENREGIMVHSHGPHIFHTSDDKVWSFVNRFAEFNNYVNRPKVFCNGTIYSFPINLMTLQQVFGRMTPEDCRKAVQLDIQQANVEDPGANMEAWALANIGPTLYEMFIRGYTTKQWGISPDKLPSSILKRVPIRYTFDDNYFNDRYQGIPIGGYSKLIETMLDHPNITTIFDANVDREFVKEKLEGKWVIFTGPIDKFFDFEYGLLPYRSLEFKHTLRSVPDFQGNAVINYTQLDYPFTRIVEHKHFDLQRANKDVTITTEEYSVEYDGTNDPYYPIRNDESKEKYDRYVLLARKEFPKVIFGGRLGAFQYYDMHIVIGEAFKCLDLLKTRGAFDEDSV